MLPAFLHAATKGHTVEATRDITIAVVAVATGIQPEHHEDAVTTVTAVTQDGAHCQMDGTSKYMSENHVAKLVLTLACVTHLCNMSAVAQDEPDPDYVRSVFNSHGDRQADVAGANCTMGFVGGGSRKVVLPSNVIVDGLMLEIFFGKHRIDFKVPPISKDQRYMYFGWYQNRLPAVQMKLIDKSINKSFAPFRPGTIVTHDIGGYYFQAGFAVPYAELRNPMDLVFRDTSGKQASLPIASLASLNYFQMLSTLDDVSSVGAKADPEQLRQLQLCKLADPSIAEQSLDKAYPPQPQSFMPPRASR